MVGNLAFNLLFFIKLTYYTKKNKKLSTLDIGGNKMLSTKNKISDHSFNSDMWVNQKFIGHTGEQFYDDGFHYQAGLFGTTKLILVDRWKDGDIVREAVDINELPEGIQNLIKAAFA